MNKHFRVLLAAVFALSAGAASVAAEAGGPSAEALAFTCAGCHGTDGSSVGPSMPSIAAMDPEVFIDAMKEYREGKRNPTIMDRIARAYTDEQIEGMAWFFARQRLRLYPQEYDADRAALGARLHRDYCENCHLDGGRPGDAGTLAGQWIPYLEYTMDDFLAGEREWPRKMEREVRAAIEEEGDRAVPALIHFYGSQH